VPAYGDTTSKTSERGHIVGLRHDDRDGLVTPVPLILHRDNAAKVHTGTTAETVIAQAVIPGGLIGRNGRVKIEALWNYSNNANAKTLKAKFGGVTVAQLGATTTNSTRWSVSVCNAGSEDEQVMPSPGVNIATTDGGSTATDNTSGAVDTSADVVVSLTVALASAADTVRLQAWGVVVEPFHD